MTDLLQEFCDSRGAALRVDRTAGVIRGIKILGPHSRNRREYLPEALARAVSLYEGAKVNVNHPKGHPNSPRDYQERMGVIRNVQHRAGDGLFADFHFNPKHYLSEQLIWDAEHTPENVGFSHNVQARTSRRGDPNTGEPVLIGANTVLVMPAYRHAAHRVFNAAEIHYTGASSPTNTVAANPLGNYTVVESRLAYRRVLASGVTAVDAKKWWFIGDFRKAFAYMENWPITVAQSPAGSEADFNSDIVVRFKASERGAAAVMNPRYVVKNTG